MWTTLGEFLERTAGEDRQFLAGDDLREFLPTVCGMANGAGGWVVLGAEEAEDPKAGPQLIGVPDPPRLRERLESLLEGKFSAPVGVAFRTLRDAPLLLAQVSPAKWRDRPLCVGRDYAKGTWRRVEGVNILCGRRVRVRWALDALERLRDDSPLFPYKEGKGLHGESVATFREAVIARRPQWGRLPLPDLLSRALILSGGNVTRAGFYLLGEEGPAVRVELQGQGDAPGRRLEVRNLWRAWALLLPRLTRSLSPACAAAFRECFVNALIHADYDAAGGGVRVLLAGSPASARIENPGAPRAWKPNESACRNFRLMKAFQLLGAARGEGLGLGAIRRYHPEFRLDQDPLELTTVAALPLEPRGGGGSVDLTIR